MWAETEQLLQRMYAMLLVLTAPSVACCAVLSCSNGGNATLYGQDSSASIVDANVNAGKVGGVCRGCLCSSYSFAFYSLYSCCQRR